MAGKDRTLDELKTKLINAEQKASKVPDTDMIPEMPG
jgi:hypothetical protein